LGINDGSGARSNNDLVRVGPDGMASVGNLLSSGS
jgi:hypothetical protein